MPNLLLTVDNGIATITLNRPAVHNAFDDELIRDLLKQLKEVENDEKIKIVILAAAGESFSAGADLNWMRRTKSYSYEENIKDAAVFANLMQTLKFLNKPTIACIQGAAYGAGLGLVACCDIAIASSKATFCFSEVKIGLIPAVISPYVISVIGERAARYYFLTAEIISAEKAQQLHLVTQVVAPEQLNAVTQQLAERIRHNGPQAVCAAKKLIDRVIQDPYSEENRQENTKAIATIRTSKEGQEGLSAFLEKRKPHWLGE